MAPILFGLDEFANLLVDWPNYLAPWINDIVPGSAQAAMYAAPVSRDEAAAALGLARQTAAFHLDRLADAELLDVVYERRSGRTGPGAGRPAKLYRRSPRQVAVSLPDRRYELAGRLLAQAVEESDATGERVRDALHRKAEELGEQLAGQHAVEVFELLERYGFEPCREGDAVVLANCPFHAPAREHTMTVCGMNLHLLRGVLRGARESGLKAHLAPTPGRCRVRLEPAVETPKQPPIRTEQSPTQTLLGFCSES